MDNFEALIRLLLEEDGYWTLGSVKVNLSKFDKKELSKPSMPRPELDIVAYKQSKNELLVMEVKSYLDSYGVRVKDFENLNQEITNGVYKTLTRPKYRETVERVLLSDLRKKGFADNKTTIRWGLAAGNIYSKDEIDLRRIFDGQKWQLWGPNEIAQKARNLASLGYENDPFIIMTKILERNEKASTK